jgi:hypothetical protein
LCSDSIHQVKQQQGRRDLTWKELLELCDEIIADRSEDE